MITPTPHPIHSLHVLLWSFNQGSFHLETMRDTVRTGMSAYADNNLWQDYIVIGVSHNRKDLDRLRDLLVEKYGYRQPPKKILRAAS